METTVEYWDYIGVVENKMETTIVVWQWGWKGGKRVDRLGKFGALGD